MKVMYGYVRASTTEQVSTLRTQQETLEKEYRHRFEQEFKWGGCFIDSGVSGNSPMLQRPMGFKLNTTIDAEDAVIITKLDRGWRNLRDFSHVLEQWQAKKIRLVLLDLNMDLGTMVGKMIAQILCAVAEFERSRMRERIAEGVKKALSEGRWCNQAPYGFKLTGHKGDHDRRLVPYPRQRAIGRMFIEWKRQGMSTEKIYWRCKRERVQNGNNQIEICLRTIDNWIKRELALQKKEAEQANGNGHANGTTAPQGEQTNASNPQDGLPG